MKTIHNNIFFKAYKFNSKNEENMFLSNHSNIKQVILDSDYGSYYYCFIGHSSLTNEKLFILKFCCDKIEEELSLLFWNDSYIIDTGKVVYLIDSFQLVKKSIEISTPLIGLYLIDDLHLLILEEACLRVVSFSGEIVKTEFFDLIENYNLTKDNVLYLNTNGNNYTIKLI